MNVPAVPEDAAQSAKRLADKKESEFNRRFDGLDQLNKGFGTRMHKSTIEIVTLMNTTYFVSL